MGYQHLDEALPMLANHPLPFPRHLDSKALPPPHLRPPLSFLPLNTEEYLWDECAHRLDIAQKFRPKAGHQNHGLCSSLGKDDAR